MGGGLVSILLSSSDANRGGKQVRALTETQQLLPTSLEARTGGAEKVEPGLKAELP